MSLEITRDLRNLFGPVRDQGPRPTCLAFAVSDAHAALLPPFRPLSVEYLYYHAVQKTPDRDPEKGIDPSAAGEALLKDGQPLEVSWPYLNTLPTPLSLWVPPRGCSVFCRELPNSGKSVDRVCKSLDAGIPVVLGLLLSESFFLPGADGLIQQKPHDPETGLHAVIAVGYGETRAERVILVRNSWGTRWGLSGCAFVEESYLDKRIVFSSAIF
jgi:hypothetical protein